MRKKDLKQQLQESTMLYEQWHKEKNRLDQQHKIYFSNTIKKKVTRMDSFKKLELYFNNNVKRREPKVFRHTQQRTFYVQLYQLSKILVSMNLPTIITKTRQFINQLLKTK